MDYYFGAGNRYVITPFSNCGVYRIDFLTLDMVGRPESIVEHFAAIEFNNEVSNNIPDYPTYNRFLRLTHAETGRISIFNQTAADYFALFNGYMHERPKQVYEFAFLRCLEEDNFAWIFGTAGQDFLRRLENFEKDTDSNSDEINTDSPEPESEPALVIGENCRSKSVN